MAGSEAWWTEGTKHDRGKAKLSVKAERHDIIEPDDSDTHGQEYSMFLERMEAMLKDTREARKKWEERKEGWVSDKSGGCCCQCDSRLGFSRSGRHCGACRHKRCPFYFDNKETENSATEEQTHKPGF